MHALRPFVRLAQATVVICLTASPIRSASAQKSDPYLARVKRVLATTPLIDGHNDLPWRIREDKAARGNVDAYDLRSRTPGHTDFARLKTGMIGAQFWSVYTPGE